MRRAADPCRAAETWIRWWPAGALSRHSAERCEKLGYRYRLNGKTRKCTIGAFPNVDLVNARKLARDAVTSVGEGVTPALKRKRPAEARVRRHDCAQRTKPFVDGKPLQHA
jgi:hypothetical protein